jgi:hypothetical protein
MSKLLQPHCGPPIGQPPARIDILQHIDGITFDEAWANRIQGLIDGQIHAAVISREDLIRNKLATGREQDMLDAKLLLRSQAVSGAHGAKFIRGTKPIACESGYWEKRSIAVLPGGQSKQKVHGLG